MRSHAPINPSPARACDTFQVPIPEAATSPQVVPCRQARKQRARRYGYAHAEEGRSYDVQHGAEPRWRCVGTRPRVRASQPMLVFEP